MTRPTDMPKDSKPVLTPKLRFPEFRNSSGWQEKQIGEICRLYQAETISSSEFIPNGAHLVYGANGVVGRLDRYNHEDEEVIVSCRGVCGEVHFTKPRSWITGNSMVVAPRTDDLQKPFLYRLLSAANLKPIISGSAQPQITRQGFSPFLVHIPSTLAEQQKIAECLSTLDELIGAESQKLDALKAHKKGLMQQLFPREGETLPRLRFPEFHSAPAWEEKSIGDFGDVITGSTPSTAKREYYDGDIPFVSPADISELRFVETTKTRLTELGFAETRPIRAGSVVFVCIGSTIGKVAQVRRDSTTNQQINSVVPNSDHDDAFVYYALLRNSDRIAKLAGKQAVPIVNKSLFSSVRLPVPKWNEQHRIATCLSSLDDLIAAQSERLSALQTHKQGLLQQLFPSPAEAGV